MSKLVLALFDGEARSAGDGHRRTGIFTYQFELAPSQGMYRRCEEEVCLGAQRIS